jgi:hypothetical protein
MKRILVLLSIAAFAQLTAHAGDIKVEVKLAQNKDSKPTTIFTSETPQIYASFTTLGTKKDDRLRGVWIAEDVGNAAAKDSKIDEATVTGDKDNFSGSFSLSKPTKGWPPGDYRLEIYAGDDLVKTADFEITGKTSEADAEKDTDDVHKDSGDDDKD